jgi:hypothetical protein
VVSHFGISDYGRNNPNGWWYQTAGGYQPTLTAWIGGSPAAAPNKYYARDATAAILNYSGGYLYLYHDTEDASVPVVHSQRINTILTGAGRTNFAYSETTAASNPRWLHGYPSDATGIEQAIPTWMAHIKARTTISWSVGTTGTLTVLGYCITKRFSIWLNSGQDAAATVIYDTVAGTYQVTPLTTGDILVDITQGSKHAVQTISGVTTITVV